MHEATLATVDFSSAERDLAPWNGHQQPRRPAAECGGARQCVHAGDKEGSDFPTAAAAELEVAARGKNTMLVPEDSSGSAPDCDSGQLAGCKGGMPR
jgi:hypothetical protein